MYVPCAFAPYVMQPRIMTIHTIRTKTGRLSLWAHILAHPYFWTLEVNVPHTGSTRFVPYIQFCVPNCIRTHIGTAL